VDGKNENARSFSLSACSSIFLQHAVAYVNQLKMPVARERLIIIIIIIIIIIQKRPRVGSATVRGRCGAG